MGAGLFVRQGASVTLTDGGFSGGTVTGGICASAASRNGQGIGTGLFLAGSASYSVTAGNTVTISDTLGGGADALITGGFTKSGPGTLTLSSTNSYTGGTTINGGVLQANETITANVSATGVGPVTVNNGGTLAGGNSGGTTGSVRGNVTVNSGGSIAPGSSGPGILTLNGNVAFSSGSTLSLDLNGVTVGSDYDQLKVNGTVNLGGATLTLAGSFAPTPGQTFKVVDNDGSDTITNTFAGLAEGARVSVGNGSFTISYEGDDGNDVVLTAIPLTPDIAVTQTSAVADGGSVDFGPVTLGSSSAATTFTITNPGGADLSTLALTGATSEFTVTALSGTSIPVGSGSVTFSVTFTPSASGARTATLQIASNVVGAKNPYDIVLTGTGQTLFQAWAAANSTTTDNANLPSFAFGTAPGATGDLTFSGTFAAGGTFSHGGHVTKLESTTNGVDFRALFVRRKDRAAAGLTYTPQFGADDLGTWVDSTATPTVIADDGDFELVSIPYPPSIGKKKVRFFRLRLTLNP